MRISAGGNSQKKKRDLGMQNAAGVSIGIETMLCT